MARSRSNRRKKRSRRRPEPPARSGSMMSMRDGFRRLAGSGQRKPRDRGNAFLGWLLLIVFVIILVLWLIR